MSSEITENIPTIDHKPHAAFFRQSGWLMITAVAGGALTYGVHFLNKVIDPAEYTAFGVLLTLVACLPVGPVQMVFTQQSALAIASGRRGQLSYLIRLTFLWILLLWALGAIAVLLFAALHCHGLAPAGSLQFVGDGGTGAVIVVVADLLRCVAGAPGFFLARMVSGAWWRRKVVWSRSTGNGV